LILILVLQALFIVGAVASVWLVRRADGPEPALQVSFFYWLLAASEVFRLVLGWLGDPRVTGVCAIVGVLGLLLGLTIHLTQRERSRKDGVSEPLGEGPSWLIAGLYLLGSASWLATLLMVPRPTADVLGAMGALSVVVASVVLFFAAVSLSLLRGRPGPLAVGGAVMAVLSAGLGAVVGH